VGPLERERRRGRGMKGGEGGHKRGREREVERNAGKERRWQGEGRIGRIEEWR